VASEQGSPFNTGGKGGNKEEERQDKKKFKNVLSLTQEVGPGGKKKGPHRLQGRKGRGEKRQKVERKVDYHKGGGKEPCPKKDRR